MERDAKSKPWPTCPVYECTECGRKASVETLTYDEIAECYWCVPSNGDVCNGQMRWIRDDPAEFVSIGLYETHRVYGGPEEGGWWYDAGSLMPMTLRSFPPEHWGTDNRDWGHAQWYEAYLRRMANERNEDARKNGSEFRYHVALYTNELVPSHFPKTRPRYS